ncbi:sulfite exporter TauE/SafE family protein [Allorhizobium sp. BGMRC 0089]|uniref:sulfite exporter TauE/SafE family protein n=1 Tax=Allorhizobium sonneratiae TaxID=2934936 RepID=UPI00203378B4|nr:sulfite exporter TauE/SafE family protein [Allorhizobium sonneratiae]MCM2290873.1 sulfite exporter TauE/SafE family protein [Allorhizobium sonneratiae]
MLTDIQFYLAAIPAVFLVGLSKGGLGGAFSLMAVPILALAVPPLAAAAIFLPILIVMDAVALYSWRHENDRKTLIMLLPGALAGIGIGYLTSALVPVAMMRLALGLITTTFAGRYFLRRLKGIGHDTLPARRHHPLKAGLWGSVAGYASFIAHAGGPPFEIYALPLKLNPRSYTGASVRFFAILNAVKLIPYIALGELDFSNFKLSLVLMPLALISTMIGAAIVRRLKPETFYPLVYGMTLLAGVKLIADSFL